MVSAQEEIEAFCREFIEVAFEEFGQHCAGLENNSVCYGYGTMNTTFATNETVNIPAADLDILLTVGDHSPLFDAETNQVIESVQTVRFNPIEDTAEEAAEATPEAEMTPEAEVTVEVEDWGISLIYSSGNIPQQIEDPGIRIMLIGDARLENAIPADKTFIPGVIVEVKVEAADMYTAPPEYRIESEVIANMSGEFEADAISPDGEWVRVFYMYERAFGLRATAWLEVASLLDEPDLSELPILGADYGSPMQESFLSMDTANDDCDGEQTTGILIQGVEGIETDVWVNDLPMRLTSTVFIELFSDDTMTVIALDGIIAIVPDGGEELILIPGFGTDIATSCLDDEDDLGIDGEANDQSVTNCTTTAGEPQLLENSELAQYAVFASLPDNIASEVSTITVIEASGEGGAIGQVTTSNTATTDRINVYCNTGNLPNYVCSASGN